MADSKSSSWQSLTPLELAQIAVDQVSQAYDLALELSTFLEVINEPEDPPKWAFPLQRMVDRIRDAADEAHTAALRTRGGIGGVAPDVNG